MIAYDLLGFRIPFDDSVQSSCYRRQMACRHGLHVGVNVAHGLATFADATEEVVLVPLVRLAFVQPLNIFVGVGVLVPVLFDRFSSNFATADEDPTLT